MPKLKLDLDQLVVESFDTHASGIAPRGTVRAHSELCVPTFGEFSCVDTCGTCALTCDTCDGTCSCGGSCGYSCGGGCSGGYTCGGTCVGTCVDPTCNTCYTNCEQVSCVETCP